MKKSLFLRSLDGGEESAGAASTDGAQGVTDSEKLKEQPEEQEQQPEEQQPEEGEKADA